MLRAYEAFWVLTLVLDVYCLVRAITAPEDEIQHMPRIFWILLILFFPLVGSLVFLAAGTAPARRRAQGHVAGYPEYDRPGRMTGVTPDSDEAFLRQLKERAEEQRRKAAEQKRAEQRKAEGEKSPEGGEPSPSGS